MIGDHIRAVVNLIADGVFVSNVGRGYILRRLIRRAVRHGRQLGIQEPFLKQLAQVAFSLSREAGLVHITNNQKLIERELETEELRFLDVLKKGESRLYEILEMSSVGYKRCFIHCLTCVLENDIRFRCVRIV